VRYLLADEVGQGKTIEAGLIIRELELPLAQGSNSRSGSERGPGIPPEAVGK